MHYTIDSQPITTYNKSMNTCLIMASLPGDPKEDGAIESEHYTTVVKW